MGKIYAFLTLAEISGRQSELFQAVPGNKLHWLCTFVFIPMALLEFQGCSGI